MAKEIEKQKKAKQIFLRVSDNLYKSIERAIDIGIADNAPEFVRRCIVNQLMELNLLQLEEKE